jgi:hypothetical protein
VRVAGIANISSGGRPSSLLSRFETRSGPEKAALPAIVAEADLDGLRLSAANDFAVTPPGEKYLGAERFRVHLVGSR